jgi:hypothetical protein
MQIDIGTIVLLLAALIFYLRLIIIQRQRAKNLRRRPPGNPPKKTRAEKSGQALENYSIVSRSPRRWLVAGAGVVAILAGVLLYLDVLPFRAVQAYWWLPVAAGIIAFSWGFE